MPDGAGLARLVDASAILSAEQQAHIAALHAEDHWAVDIAASSVVLTAPDGGRLVCPAHFLGTSAPGPSTWLWGWQNINGFPERFVALAEQVRVAGEQQGVAELTTAELPLDPALPRLLTLAAKTITGLPMHYSGPIGGGSRAWLLIEHPDLALPAPTAGRTADAILAAIDTVAIADHAQALDSWARARAVVATADEDDGRVVRLALPDGDVLVRFDDDRRIRQVEEQTAAGLDAAAPGPTSAADRTPTAAVDLVPPAQEGPPHQDPEQQDPEQQDPEQQGPQPESSMRRLLGFLRGPRP